MAKVAYKAMPGAFLLVEVYFGTPDELFHVATREAGDELTTKRLEFFSRSNSEGFASWHLFDDQGNELPRLDKGKA